jgi:cell division protein FtsB
VAQATSAASPGAGRTRHTPAGASRSGSARAGAGGASGARTAGSSGARRTRSSGARRAAPSGARKHAPRPHFGRIALLALVLIGASFYVSPLRAFFTQQDRYEKAAAQLAAAKQDNAALEREVKLLTTKAYIAQRARSDAMLVPPGSQVFVIKGLPGKEDETKASDRTKPVQASISVLDRVEDLWRTLLH